MRTLERTRLQPLMEREQKKFIADRPKSAALFERARKSLLGGVPMNWMAKWAGAFPPFVREARGAEFFDVDGHRYIDLCLGDTGAMTGHSPSATVMALEQQARRGITLMLPSEDAIVVGEELQKRFGLPFWQFALTATDANRFSIRLARHITGRPKILVFNWCYHGTVDESFITLQDGVAKARRGNVGPPVDPAVTTAVVEFNDLSALEAALKRRYRLRAGRACVDERRHRVARSRIPRRPARDHAQARHATDHRRDSYHLRRAGRLHSRGKPRAGFPGLRQADRGRRARRGVRVHGRGRAVHLPIARIWKTATLAALAARWRATRSRWRR